MCGAKRSNFLKQHSGWGWDSAEGPAQSVILLHFTVSGEGSHGVWFHPHDLLCFSGFHISSQGVTTLLHSSPAMHSWQCRYIHIHVQHTYLYTIAIYGVCTLCLCVCTHLQLIWNRSFYHGAKAPALARFLTSRLQREPCSPLLSAGTGSAGGEMFIMVSWVLWVSAAREERGLCLRMGKEFIMDSSRVFLASAGEGTDRRLIHQGKVLVRIRKRQE